jgi:hypothetical protein
MDAGRKAGVGLALEQATPGTLCYVADIQPGGSAALHGGERVVPRIGVFICTMRGLARVLALSAHLVRGMRGQRLGGCTFLATSRAQARRGGVLAASDGRGEDPPMAA